MTKQLAVLVAILLAFAVLHPVALIALGALAVLAVGGVWALIVVRLVTEGRRYTYRY